jgi:hypothetical protein
MGFQIARLLKANNDCFQTEDPPAFTVTSLLGEVCPDGNRD